MTKLSNADSNTNWVNYRLAGSGQFSTTPNAATDVFLEGSGSLSAKFNANNQESGIMFDYYTANGNAALDMSSGNGNEVFGIWVQVTTPSKILSRAAGGLYLIVQFSTATGASNAPSNWAKWYVKGADVYDGGWIFLKADSRKTPSATNGTVDWTNVCRIGAGITNVASMGTILADNFYVDALFAGRPVYNVQGDGSTVATWADFLADSSAQFNGLVRDVGGVYIASCGFKFGDNAQSSTTTFQDETGQQIVFERVTYYNGTAVVDVFDYATLYTITAEGAAAAGTTVELGRVVGTGNDRQGVLGGALRSSDSANVPVSLDMATDITHLTSIKMYGVDFVGMTGGIKFDDASKTSIVSAAFQNCGLVDLGTTGAGAELLNFALIDPLGATNNRGLLMKQNNNISQGSFITSGSPTTQHMIYFDTAADYTVSFTGMSFYGDFSSGTLWHGENSGLNADVTISAANSNPTQAEFNNTNGGTMTVSNTVAVTLTGLQDNTEIRVLAQGTQTELQGIENTSGGSYVISQQAGTAVDIIVFHLEYDPIYYLNYTVPASATSIPVQQIFSRNYSDPP